MVKMRKLINEEESAFEELPMEMYFKIFSYLSLASIREARLVSKNWKLMVDTSRNLNFVCHLTDETTSSAVNSTVTFARVKIHDFSGIENKVVSSTRGTGRLLSTTDSIFLIGSNINSAEIAKMMRYAAGNVKELSFKICRRDIILSVLELKSPFSSLRKLVIGYKSFPRRNHTIVFEKLASEDRGPQLPFLESFHISYDLDSVEDLYNQRLIPSAKEVFQNYLAIAKVVVKFRRTLKSVKISRNEVLRTALVLQVDTSGIIVNQSHRLQIQKCLDAFDEVDLEQLHITPMLDEGEYPWTLETSLLRRQRNLRDVLLNKKLCSPTLGSLALDGVLPLNCSLFTSVKIALTCLGNDAVDLSPFSACPNLNTLWLAFYRGVRIGPARQNSLHFTSLEKIPKQIKSLHFKSSQQDAIIIHQQSILSREQVRWVIDNLHDLESFWLQLVAEEQNEDVNGHPPLNVGAVPVLDAPPPAVDNNNNLVQPQPQAEANEDDDVDQEAQEARQLVNRVNQELNNNANVDVETFRDLISMPKIQDLKLDMLKAGQLGAILELGADGNPWILPMGVHVSLEDIREYTEVCEAAENITYSTQATSFFPFGFVELTVKKS